MRQGRLTIAPLCRWKLATGPVARLQTSALFNNQQSIGVGAEAKVLGRLAGVRLSGRALQDVGGVPKLECSHDASAVGGWCMRMRRVSAVRCLFSSRGWAAESSELELCN